MPPTKTDATRDPLDIENELRTRRSLALTRQRVENALSIACPQCAAQPSVYCFLEARGFCRYRFEKGLSISIPAPGPRGLPSPALTLPESKTAPDRRHPNRHPVRAAR
ncbi:hypothetical protein [Curtobacterium sp. VKM Ac-1395]|uniref:hypothetical protein n=1 Tax=Curtobacterium sp. VKM Ac-1395 TaxID=2783815 RepID=UPI00188D13D1|nr:hypothetical protein [Curtobacterium sp. VKM Ac-1395]MBF4591265.1 hypothetical protein [Curtobacterium sp. VKM Ac-1395]